METNVNNDWLPVNKNRIFQGNQIVGTSDGIIDANIISFEHALEKIQNKLSLPEYVGSEDFEETNKDKRYVEENTPIFDSTTEYNPKNSDMSKVGKTQTSLNTMCNKQIKPIYSQNFKITKHWKSKVGINKSHMTLKQMTLDKYSFQGNLEKMKSTKKTCSIMIACSSSTSIDNKSYTREKVLLWRNPTIMPNTSNIYGLPLQEEPFDEVSDWKETESTFTILSCINPHEERNVRSVTTQALLCLKDSSTAEEGIGGEHQSSYWKEDDPLEIDIEAAMKKYYTAIENSGEPATKYVESGVQTTPPCVHACNCLGYHMCELFKGLPDGKCPEKREIEALDLDTLCYVSRKKFSVPDAILQVPIVHHWSSDQEVPLCPQDDEEPPQKQGTSLKEFSRISNLGVFSKETLHENKSPLGWEETGLEKSFVDSKMGGKIDGNQLQDCLEQDSRNFPSEFSFNSCHYDDLYPTPNKVSKFEMLLPQENEQEISSELLKVVEMQQIYLPPQSKCFEHLVGVQEEEENAICNDSTTDNFKERDYKSMQKVFPDDTLRDFAEVSHVDQDVPDIKVELCEKDGLKNKEHVTSDGGARDSSFQWRATPGLLEPTAHKPFEEFLNLKPIPQKGRRIGLSRREKPMQSLHPRRRQNL